MKPVNSSKNRSHTVELLQALPAQSKIAQEILSINLATDKGDESLLRLIEQDPAISARIIGLANSPLYRTSKKIMTAGDAAVVLGIKHVKMVALSFAMISSVTRSADGLLNMNRLWQHSMAVALAMEVISKAMPQRIRPPAEDIYLAGLLHDIGFLVLEYVDPELSNRFHARLAAEGGQLAAELETEMLEMNHCELGALLAQHWRLPESIVAVLRHHHSSGVAQDAVGQPLITMASLAERLLPTFAVTESVPPGIEIEEWQTLGIAAERVGEIEVAMRKRAVEIAAALT